MLGKLFNLIMIVCGRLSYFTLSIPKILLLLIQIEIVTPIKQPVLMNKLNNQFSLCVSSLFGKPCMSSLFLFQKVIVLPLMWNS